MSMLMGGTLSPLSDEAMSMAGTLLLPSADGRHALTAIRQAVVDGQYSLTPPLNIATSVAGTLLPPSVDGRHALIAIRQTLVDGQ